MLENILKIRHKALETVPLVHCLTNHITINDCANIVLAVGGKPIMAEHYAEVEEITAAAKALAVNIGNITDDRMRSMLISGGVAKNKAIPSIIDIVGAGCSTLRLNFAREFIAECSPAVIKGNMSEIKALAGIKSSAEGIDVGVGDVVTEENILDAVRMAKILSEKYNAVILITGKTDIAVQGERTFLIRNGCEMLSKITGTGCMLNAVIAAFLPSGDYLGSAVLGAVMLGIAGENSSSANGTGSFKVLLHDSIFTMTDDIIREKIRLEEYR